MSDYSADVSILRGQMANMLAGNTEQMAFVLTNALSGSDMDEIIDQGQLGDEADAELVVFGLRRLADAIELGHLK